MVMSDTGTEAGAFRGYGDDIADFMSMLQRFHIRDEAPFSNQELIGRISEFHNELTELIISGTAEYCESPQAEDEINTTLARIVDHKIDTLLHPSHPDAAHEVTDQLLTLIDDVNRLSSGYSRYMKMWAWLYVASQHVIRLDLERALGMMTNDLTQYATLIFGGPEEASAEEYLRSRLIARILVLYCDIPEIVREFLSRHVKDPVATDQFVDSFGVAELLTRQRRYARAQ